MWALGDLSPMADPPDLPASPSIQIRGQEFTQLHHLVNR